MNENETHKTTLIYCGKEFEHFTPNGNAIYRYFFVNEEYIFYEFYDKGGYSVNSILSHCKPGTKINVIWKHHKKTWKKIILDAKNIPSYSGKHY